MSKQWIVLENGFPASINRATDWRRLVRGECVYQCNAAYETDGLLSYAAPPSASVNYFSQELFRDGTPTNFLLYNRWWRVKSLEEPYTVEYSDYIANATEEPVFTGSDSYDADGTGGIRMIVPYGNGNIAVLKERAAYTLTGANGDSAAWKKSFPDYSIGAKNSSPIYCSATIDGTYIVTAWDGNGAHAVRHYLWRPNAELIELSRTVRDLAADQNDQTIGINWAQNLVIVGNLCYDLDKKRAMRFDGAAATASFTSLGYHASLWQPSSISAVSFVLFGTSGSFRVAIETAGRDNAIVEKADKTVTITENDEGGSRYVWTLAQPVTLRAYRMKITGLTGLSIAQIDALVSTSDSPVGTYAI